MAVAFVVKLGARERPLPAFKALGDFCRWEYQCGWCDEKFMTAGELVAHVRQERDK